MANIKKLYKLPHTINVKEGLDQHVSLKIGIFGWKVPVPMYLIMLNIIVLAIFITDIFYMVKNNYGIIAPIMFTLSYIPLSIMMLKKTKTGERGYKWLWPTLRYYPTYKSRMIKTRSTANEDEVEMLKNVIPLEEIDPKTGIAKFVEGDKGVAIKVVGNGSNSLFESEKESIIVAYEQFLKKLEIGVHVIVDMKEGNQDCSSQISSLEKRKAKTDNATINMILDNRIDTLRGIERTFKTTEYVVYLRSNDIAKLDSTITMLRKSSNSTKELFKEIEVLVSDEVYEKYRNFYNLQ